MEENFAETIRYIGLKCSEITSITMLFYYSELDQRRINICQGDKKIVNTDSQRHKECKFRQNIHLQMTQTHTISHGKPAMTDSRGPLVH